MQCGNQQLSCQDAATSPVYCLTVPDIDRFDCSLVLESCECPTPQANPDIAGVGVRGACNLNSKMLMYPGFGSVSCFRASDLDQHVLSPNTPAAKEEETPESCGRVVDKAHMSSGSGSRTTSRDLVGVFLSRNHDFE